MPVAPAMPGTPAMDKTTFANICHLKRHAIILGLLNITGMALLVAGVTIGASVPDKATEKERADTRMTMYMLYLFGFLVLAAGIGYTAYMYRKETM